MAKTDLTAERLREILHYDQETGEFRFINHCNGRATGRYIRWDGYVPFMVDGYKTLAHRFAWLYVYGEWPKNELDHINGIRHDNRICNLREATRSENVQNVVVPNKSGFCGITQATWKGAWTGKWRAQIAVNNKKMHLGVFATKELAHAAYLSAKARLHLFNPTQRPQAQ